MAANDDILPLPPEMDRLQRVALLVGVVGIALSVIGFFVSREQFFNSYLFAWMFWLGIAVGSLALVMLHHMTGGDWGIAVRREWESAALTLPLLAIGLVPIFVGARYLFPWMQQELIEHDAVIKFQHDHY